MKRLFLFLGAFALIGSGCININVDVDADIPPEVDLLIDGELMDLPVEPAPSSENITVFEPLMNEVVDERFLVEGEARVFEQTFMWRLTDVATGDSVEDNESTNAADIGLFGPFSFKIDVPRGYGEEGMVLELFEYSAADGAQINTVEIPLWIDID